MKVKVSESTNLVLNWLVAKCEGKFIKTVDPVIMVMDEGKSYSYSFQPSTDWTQGGPIIEREKIDVRAPTKHCAEWTAWASEYSGIHQQGNTPLEAAMRCYVASKLGDEVEVPDELIKP